MLTKPKPARERLLLMGGWGSGKSNSWCTIASWMRRTKSPGKMYVVDTDHTADRQAEAYEDFYDNVEAHDVWDYDETKTALIYAKDHGGREDWLVVDLADQLWEWSQDKYIVKAFGQDALSYYMAFKEAGKEGHPLADGFGMNWSYVNKHYGELMTLIKRFPGHVMLCTPAEPTERPNNQGKGGDAADILEIFGRLGVKPKGQKRIAHDVHTVLWMKSKSERSSGKVTWLYQTAKDLHREYSEGDPVNDFVMDYLVGRAGWVLDG